jgi:Tfp pilus assembly protein PilO
MRFLGWTLLFATVFVADYLILGWGVERLVGDRLRRAEAALARQERTLEETEVVAGRRDDFEAEARRGEQELAELRAVLPDDPDLDGLDRALRGAAGAAGVAIVGMEIGKEQGREFYAERTVEVTVRGGEAGLAQFLSRLEAEPRLMSLQSLHAERRGRDLSLQLGLETYSFVESRED